ncbi:MAG: hypothetical protein MJ097_01835 [Dorea sp.]|nr:hypothetical protein [Dorea sp.]
MDKDFSVITRYHYRDGYFIAVTKENRPTAISRDYWLCKKHESKRIYMFTAPFRNEEHEELMICKNLKKALARFEAEQPALSLYA